MAVVACPHCRVHRFVTDRIPKDVLLIMACPGCKEWIVLFRNRVIPLKREILETGQVDDMAAHIAPIIVELRKMGLLFQVASSAEIGETEQDSGNLTADEPDDDNLVHSGKSSPITQQEYERFVKMDLKCIDNAAYFRKHLG